MRISLGAVMAVTAVTALTLGCPRDRTSAPSTTSSASSATTAAAPTISSADRAAAEDAVVGYYAAIAAKDCSTMVKLVTPTMSMDDCHHAVDEWAEHGGTFDRLVDAVPDGREPSVAMVTVRFASGKGARDQIIRAKKVDGGWKLVL